MIEGVDAGEAAFGRAAVAETAGRSSDVDACVALSRRMAGLLGETLAYFHQEEAGVACQVGCHFCCHLKVMVYPHEAIALFRHLGTALPEDVARQVRERLKAHAAHLRQAPPGPLPRLPCAFLIEGRCSAYEVRPSACAAYHSLSREACERGHQGEASAGIPMSQAVVHVDQGLAAGVESGLAGAGLPDNQGELQTSVAALLEKPSLISRWRAGREWPRDARGLVCAK